MTLVLYEIQAMQLGQPFKVLSPASVTRAWSRFNSSNRVSRSRYASPVFVTAVS